jgi:hypothetical protein
MTISAGSSSNATSSGKGSTGNILANIGSFWASNANQQEPKVPAGCDDFYCQLEQGMLRENLSMEELGPTPSQSKWRQSSVRKISKSKGRAYEMFTGGEFQFSARLTDAGEYMISLYRYEQEDKRDRYCAMLKPSGKHGYTLFSCACEGCDRVGKNQCQAQVCQECVTQGAPQEGRQVLARISQNVQWEESTGTDMRNLVVQVPKVNKDKETRAIWCPRSSDSENSETTTELITKLPRFSEQVGCLVMDFNGDRVKLASTKNFVMATGKEAKPMFQFGKSNDKTYVLDHRFPLAPIQAFGIGLSMCSWRVPIPPQAPN